MATATKFLADENLHGDLFAALKQHIPAIDIMRVQDTVIYQAGDERVLEYAVETKRILITHDKNTLIPLAYARIDPDVPMPGVIYIDKPFDFALVLRDFKFIVEIDEPEYFENRVLWSPVFES